MRRFAGVVAFPDQCNLLAASFEVAVDAGRLQELSATRLLN
jgi:hypothetical protein